MKLQFIPQQFQADAAKAVVDVFAGQENDSTQFYAIEENLFNGIANAPITLEDATILDNLHRVQRINDLPLSKRLEKTNHTYNLTIEMETGVGKTYTYIKTIYELNRLYGWCKFIIIVPSIAIREGVHKTFEITSDHFAAEYHTRIRFFIYNSDKLIKLADFAADNAINAMIINSQAFNSRKESARRINTPLDEFGSRRPVDVIAATNPILIIDEPQSVEGEATKERLREFNPMIMLRYSATHRPDSVYNMVYRLDAIDAYNRHLVKKIDVTGIKISGTTAATCFIYLERLNLFKDAPPTATFHFDSKQKGGIRQTVRTLKEGANIFDLSGGLEEYKDNFIIRFIDGRDNSVEFLNGMKMFAGEVIGNNYEEQIRRIQIRETIKAHLGREATLFNRGIKVLSLFFIDKVAHYKKYDDEGTPRNGDFAKYFEEEYSAAVKDLDIKNDAYRKYLDKIPVDKTHAGYFSIDNRGRITDSKITAKKDQTSDDVDAYDLIMRNKELLLDPDPVASPVRFIFSHSALREGWDNPNVFQICTLKQSSSDIRKRQEVGRGLRLCVNKNGVRIEDTSVNVLTVIASESYEEFTRKLQNEILDAVDRPKNVTPELFIGKKLSDGNIIDSETARQIYDSMLANDFVDDNGELTDEYSARRNGGNLDMDATVVKILDKVYTPVKIGNTRANNVKAKLNHDKLRQPAFQSLWNNINAKTGFQFQFPIRDLINRCIDALNTQLDIPPIHFRIQRGVLDDNGNSFTTTFTKTVDAENLMPSVVGYDVIGRLVLLTTLTRRDIISILGGIDNFAQIENNPEEFIIKVAQIINAVKIQFEVDNINYNPTGGTYNIDIFDEEREGRLDSNAIEAAKHLYSHVIYDSEVEKKFAQELEANADVAVYVKLPHGYSIPTPVGKYNPDWAVAFRDGDVHFVAETKGSTDANQLRGVERSKIHCAKKHFDAGIGDARYVVVDKFDSLIDNLSKR